MHTSCIAKLCWKHPRLMASEIPCSFQGREWPWRTPGLLGLLLFCRHHASLPKLLLSTPTPCHLQMVYVRAMHVTQIVGGICCNPQHNFPSSMSPCCCSPSIVSANHSPVFLSHGFFRMHGFLWQANAWIECNRFPRAWSVFNPLCVPPNQRFSRQIIINLSWI